MVLKLKDLLSKKVLDAVKGTGAISEAKQPRPSGDKSAKQN